jgi:hypothetical protein
MSEARKYRARSAEGQRPRVSAVVSRSAFYGLDRIAGERGMTISACAGDIIESYVRGDLVEQVPA